MILIDYNPLAIAAAMQQLKGNIGYSNLDFFRHLALNSIRAIRRKFSRGEYGQIIICADGPKSWRKEVWPLYKASRALKQGTEKDQRDWENIREYLNTVFEEIRNTFPYICLKVDGCEADDIIAVLAQKHAGMDKVIIVSRDKDFIQLHDNLFCEQWDHINSKFIRVSSPDTILKEHIIGGDPGDGVPNILSDDDTFVNPDKRQAPMTKKRLADLMTDPLLEANVNYQRNKKLISFESIPEEIRQRILDKYDQEYQTCPRDRSKLLSYMTEHQLVELLDRIQEF